MNTPPLAFGASIEFGLDLLFVLIYSCYAMFSIGILGFIVWSLVALIYVFVNKNLSICWNYLLLKSTGVRDNLMSMIQSAEKYIINISFSMTTCQSSFDFTSFHLIYKSIFNTRANISDDFLHWFIGFSEGDGALLCTGTRPRFVLTQKESAVLFMIRSELGFGSVRQFKGKTGNIFYRFVVEDLKSVLVLAHLFNGNLVMPNRVEQLQKWLKVLLTRPSLASLLFEYPLNRLNYVPTPSLQDSWICGFSDAEGCFNLNSTKRNAVSAGYRVILRFLLDQKNSFEALSIIRAVFGFGHVAQRSDKSGNYRLTINSLISVIPVRAYFTAFPLKTKKALVFKKWCLAHDLIMNGEHLSVDGMIKIRKIKEDINRLNKEA